MRGKTLFAEPGNQLKAVDFFSGAGGMSRGLVEAGIRVLGGIDIDGDCGLTYRYNIPDAKFVQGDISLMQPVQLAEELGLERNDPDLVMIGCSPCQFYSQIRTDKTKSADSALLLHEFQRFVEYFRPGFVVIENVPRMKKEGVKDQFALALAGMGFSFADGVLNASGFGVPQNRLRYVMIASRLPIDITLPSPNHGPRPTVQEFIGRENGFPSIAAGTTDDSDFQHTTARLTDSNLLRIAMTPPNGGDRSSWSNHPQLQLEAYRGRSESFRDTYGRMSWDRPAPTITTKFLSLSNGRFGHPVESRAISIREGATLQTFPKDFRFHASNLHGMARQIGNAVPPALAHQIGLHLVALAQSRADKANRGMPTRADGRATRAKATLHTVRAAYEALIQSGDQPTARAILAITKGSKQSVLKHLKAVRVEKLGSVGPATATVDVSQTGLTIEALLNGLTSGSIARASGAAPQAHDALYLAGHPLLKQAIELGYISLVVTQNGVDRLASNANLKLKRKPWGGRRTA